MVQNNLTILNCLILPINQDQKIYIDVKIKNGVGQSEVYGTTVLSISLVNTGRTIERSYVAKTKKRNRSPKKPA